VPGLEEAVKLALERPEILDSHGIEVAVGAREDDRDLPLDAERFVLGLLENLDEPGASRELRLRGLVEVAAELRERRETELPTLMAGRTPWWKRSDSRKICPSVIEITFVGM
jgi:hypothetical protein